MSFLCKDSNGNNDIVYVEWVFRVLLFCYEMISGKLRLNNCWIKFGRIIYVYLRVE